MSSVAPAAARAGALGPPGPAYSSTSTSCSTSVPGRSWLFSGVLGAGQTVEGIFGLLWLGPLIGFLAVTWGYFTQQGWWLQLALASAALSLVMILLWWGGINNSSAFFALVFDVAVIVVVLWQLRAGTLAS